MTSLEELQEIIERTPSECVLVVGTGVTRASAAVFEGDPRLDPTTWAGLIQNGLTFAALNGALSQEESNELSRSVERLFSSNPFSEWPVLKICDTLWSALKINNIDDAWMNESVGKLKISNDEGRHLLTAIASLSKLSIPIITTNYDNFIDEITELPTVDWLDKRPRIFSALSGNDPAVIHIHGTYKNCKSIVFGDQSYIDLDDGEALKIFFLAANLFKTWIYIGCGNGLDDPHFGKLLRWVAGRVDNNVGRADYFIGLKSDFDVLEGPRRGVNIKCVPITNFSELPALLRSLVPANRPAPFVELDPSDNNTMAFFTSHKSNSQDLRPTWDEFERGDLAQSPTEGDIEQRLANDGFAAARGGPGSGKTTTALRLAAKSINQGAKVYWLRCAEETRGAQTAFRRIANKGTFFIIDDAQLNRNIALDLYKAWQNFGAGSRMLILITDGRGVATKEGVTSDALANAVKPIKMKTDPQLFRRLAITVMRRAASSSDVPAIDTKIGEQWYRDFAQSVSIFVMAASYRYKDLLSGKFEISPSDAIDWLNSRLLNGLSSKERENVAFLAIATEMAVRVPTTLVPHPTRINALMEAGIVEMRQPSNWKEPVLRIAQPDVWPSLIREALEMIIAEKAGDWASVILLGRLLSQPQNAKTLLESCDDPSKKQIEGRVFDFWPDFELRLQSLPPRAIASFIAAWERSIQVDIAARFTGEIWEKKALLVRPSLMGGGSLAQILFIAEQPSVSDMLACAIVERALRADFTNFPYNVLDFGNAVNCAKSASTQEKINFIDEIWTPIWLKSSLNSTMSSLSLVSCIYKIARYQNKFVCDRLVKEPHCRTELRTYFSRKIAELWRVDQSDVADAIRAIIQLTGVFALIDLCRQGQIVDGLQRLKKDSAILAIVARLPLQLRHRPEVPTIEMIQRQLWIGLRAFCSLTNCSIHVTEEPVRETLALWKALEETEFPNLVRADHAIAINRGMIEWLESCIAIRPGWLFPSDIPLARYTNMNAVG